MPAVRPSALLPVDETVDPKLLGGEGRGHMRHVGRLGPRHQLVEVSSQGLDVRTVCIIFDDEGEVRSSSKGSHHDLEMGEFYV